MTAYGKILTGIIITAAALTAYVMHAEAQVAEPIIAQSLRPVKIEKAAAVEEPPVTAQEPQEQAKESLGEYLLTAYCSCEKCCGKWANNRPKDDNGAPIIYTANGSIAQQGVTIAADTSVLPFGTQVEIDGHTYTVQDVGGAIKGQHIDIYFSNHQDALEFGVKTLEIYKIKETNNHE